VQISSQALGPLISGILRDMSDNYDLSLIVFMAMSILAAIIGAIISPPYCK
jgi:cyanate permease